MDSENTIIRQIREDDDKALADIIRKNLEKFHLDIPGTVYFDPELNHLSRYYTGNSGNRAYFVVEDGQGLVLGGIGIDCFPGFENCAEIQKLYLSEEAKGRGLGKKLLQKSMLLGQDIKVCIWKPTRIWRLPFICTKRLVFMK